MIKHGADVNAKASNGMTSLTLTNSLDWLDVAEVLKENGATVQLPKPSCKTGLESTCC